MRSVRSEHKVGCCWQECTHANAADTLPADGLTLHADLHGQNAAAEWVAAYWLECERRLPLCMLLVHRTGLQATASPNSLLAVRDTLEALLFTLSRYQEEHAAQWQRS